MRFIGLNALPSGPLFPIRNNIMSEHGYSLLELMLVLVIIGILTQSGLQHWQSLKLTEELVATTEQLYAFIVQVKQKANWQNRTFHISIEHQASSWTVLSSRQSRDPLTALSDIFYQPYPSVQLLALPDRSQLAFYGQQNSAQPNSLTLKSAGGITRIIISNQGRIRYCRVTGSLSGIVEC